MSINSVHGSEPPTGQRSRSGAMFIAAVAGTVLALTALATVFISSAAAVERVGPRDPAHGYPVWYEDSSGLKLELCLSGPPLCLEGLPKPKQPAFVSKRPCTEQLPRGGVLVGR